MVSSTTSMVPDAKDEVPAAATALPVAVPLVLVLLLLLPAAASSTDMPLLAPDAPPPEALFEVVGVAAAGGGVGASIKQRRPGMRARNCSRSFPKRESRWSRRDCSVAKTTLRRSPYEARAVGHGQGASTHV